MISIKTLRLSAVIITIVGMVFNVIAVVLAVTHKGNFKPVLFWGLGLVLLGNVINGIVYIQQKSGGGIKSSRRSSNLICLS